MFAASPSQSNDIPEGGTGELRVATATGHQQERRLVAGKAVDLLPVAQGAGLVQRLGGGGGLRRGCDAGAVVWEAQALCSLPSGSHPSPVFLGAGGGQGGGGDSLRSPRSEHPAPCRAFARGSSEMPTSLRPPITPSPPKLLPNGSSISALHQIREGGLGPVPIAQMQTWRLRPRGRRQVNRSCEVRHTRMVSLQVDRGHGGARARRAGCKRLRQSPHCDRGSAGASSIKLHGEEGEGRRI